MRYSSKQWPSKITNFRFVKILRTQIWKMSLKSMKTLGNDVFRSGWYWNSIAQSENRLITKISVRNFRIVDFLWIFRGIFILLGHCFELYPAAEGRNVMENARFVRFAQSRYFLEKKSSKNIKFQESYSWWTMRWTRLSEVKGNPI